MTHQGVAGPIQPAIKQKATFTGSGRGSGARERFKRFGWERERAGHLYLTFYAFYRRDVRFVCQTAHKSATRLAVLVVTTSRIIRDVSRRKIESPACWFWNYLLVPSEEKYPCVTAVSFPCILNKSCILNYSLFSDKHLFLYTYIEM